MKTTHTKQSKVSTKKAKRRYKSLVTGSIVAFLIVISPYIFYLYESFPDEKIWRTQYFTFESKLQESAYFTMWVILGKFVPLFLLLLWFLTCKHWWYHAILVPIAMYSFQLYTAINDEVQYHDDIEMYWLIPIMMIVTPIVYFIRIKLFDKLIHGIDLKKIEAELDEYERKEKEAEKHIELK